ncbi:MAG: hypothetical protein CO183_01565 [Candidatus Zambryskibacteria bacterium CG_4_9_14_3_um_filter_42_9]|uniref:Uncharacterized protein n=1 Tax=Candidatus Zambryskibacteria bacterium CG22_combo_CG10-13_8_21_14_all_42_17 TaxID=1975118 RepID=A0A2H0BEC8_9BACT|nr:MAG: hypothetical protein COX06_00065 [Candidatus Zambryskibacteria bacterium CG22_combo_CG10-13_8_21_14_all_42_17]PJA36815.1 MAG: hypothetical protein CO183_01565 [Candidatus Zambryskibacteria bacterium CG_4_9_14_3_um_filter_42_9]
MDIITKNKGILAIIAIFIVVMFLYNTFFKGETIAVVSELEASTIGDDLIRLRQELEKVTLDQAIFSSPGYLLLNDFSTAVTPQETGRPNPFDIIGRD